MRLYGIPKYKYHSVKDISPYKHPTHHNVIGKYRGELVYHWEGPAGHNIQKEWIYILDKGIRRIFSEELTQLKGLTNTRYSNVTPQVLIKSVWNNTFGQLLGD